MNEQFDSRNYYNGKITGFKLGIFGSRSLNGDDVRMIIHKWINEKKPTKIITAQEPRGVCEVAQRTAKDLAIPLQLHFINMRYLTGAYEQRSIEVITECDYMLFIHDGKSKGTANEIVVCKKLNKPYTCEILTTDELTKNVGYNIKNEWTKNEFDFEW